VGSAGSGAGGSGGDGDGLSRSCRLDFSCVFLRFPSTRRDHPTPGSRAQENILRACTRRPTARSRLASVVPPYQALIWVRMLDVDSSSDYCRRRRDRRHSPKARTSSSARSPRLCLQIGGCLQIQPRGARAAVARLEIGNSVSS